MKASLIMTVYNAEKFIPNVLDNVFSQKFEDFELIAVNDGSSDDSYSKLSEYAKHEPRLVIINQKNSGAGVARQNGIDIARGEYVGFVDCDDELSVDMLKENLTLLDRYSGEVIMYGYSRYYLDSGKETFELPANKVLTFTSNKDFGQSFLQINSSSDLGFVWNKLIRRSLLVKNNIEFPNVKTEEDAIFVYQVLKKAQTLVVNPKSYYRYYMRKSSLSHRITDLVSLEHDIDKRRLAATELFEHWGLKYNYVLGHNDIRLLDVYFRQIFSDANYGIKTRRKVKNMMRVNKVKALKKVLLNHFKSLTNKDRFYLLAVVFHMYFLVYMYNKRS
ncbi:hypothetical protein DA798_10205 [Lactobacillus sp. PFC-70]|nr:hypothetical protein DA798_10205 [Lactobacillus sp. PFC-70]